MQSRNEYYLGNHLQTYYKKTIYIPLQVADILMNIIIFILIFFDRREQKRITKSKYL